MKPCSKCKQNKQLSEFHKNRSKNDGFQDYCKSCDKIRLREYLKTAKGKAANLKAVKNYQETVKGKVAHRRYKQSRKGRAAQKLFREHHQNYIKAIRSINSAVIAGKLSRPDTLQCHYCPNQAQEYHHHKGYEKEHWLDVLPACRKCHDIKHRKIA